MNDYWKKAIDAAQDARILLAAGKANGAASRAYYAMYDAARAALETVDLDLAKAKSHSAIISRFGNHIVVGQGVDPDLGRYLNTTEDLRIAADYDRTGIPIENARETVERMDKFLAAIAGLLGENPP